MSIEITNIKTKEDVLEYMKRNIKYGWIDINGDKHINTMKDFRRLYKTSSVEDTIKNKLGTCIEQVSLMKYLCDIANIKSKMYSTRIYERDDYDNLEEEEHMHCFLLVFEDNKVYHLEHPNFNRIGIYEYSNEEEAIKTINDYYEKLSNGVSRPVTEYTYVPVGISFKEFNAYLNNLGSITNKKK